MSGSGQLSPNENADPLYVTTHLLSDALARLRIFVFGLDPMQWLLGRDRNILYTSQICCLAILKASVGVGELCTSKTSKFFDRFFDIRNAIQFFVPFRFEFSTYGIPVAIWRVFG